MASSSCKTSLRTSGWAVRTVVVFAALVGSAYLLALDVSAPRLWWLGWVTLLPLFYAIRSLPRAAAGVGGAIWGASVFAFSRFLFDTPLADSFGSLLLLTCVPAAYAFAGASLTRKIGFSPYLLALGWVGVEFALRPVGLSYGLVAATQGEGFAIHVVGSYTGYVLVAFAVAYFNALLFSVLIELQAFRGSGRQAALAPLTPPRIHPADCVIQLLHFARPAQPRAPPALA